MIRRRFLALLAWLLLCGYTTVVVPTALNPTAAIAWNAQGTYAASTLPKMCVNGHIATASAAQTLSLLTTLGSTCTRVDFNWDSIEQSAGVYGWNTNTFGGATFAAFFGALCGASIQQIFVATYNNGLYASGVFQPIGAGANTTAWANFAGATGSGTGAGLAKEAVSLSCPSPMIEGFNEANLPNWTTTQWSGAQYAPALSALAAASKASQSSVKVISSGISPGSVTGQVLPWTAQMVSAGAPFTNVDYWGYHPYSYSTTTPSLTATPDQLLLDLKAYWLYAGSGGAAKPIAITEYGFPWDALGSSLTQGILNQQGIYIGWGMLNSIVANVTLGSPGVPYFTIYDMVDDGTSYVPTGPCPTCSDQNSFGLFFNGSASSGSPISGATAYGIKPAGAAFKSVTAAMAGSISYSISYDIANSAPTLAFKNAIGTNFAIWTTDASSSKSWSKAIGPFSSVTCKDLIGNSVSCPYSGGNLSATLSTATGPIIATALN